MSDGPVAFLDSGVGGLPYLVRTRELLPHHRFVYYADTAHFPYGERTHEEIRSIVTAAAERVVERYAPRLVVVACNTASVVALADLRDRLAVPFVGVVPAIKPAAALGAGSIGVLATSRTVEDRYVTGLIRQFAPGRTVVLVAAGGLVELIEHGLDDLDRDAVERVLAEPVARLREAGVVSVVLACTHFIHVRDLIGRLIGPSIALVDSVEGVARQTARLAGPPPPGQPVDLMAVSDAAGPDRVYRALAARLGLLMDVPVAPVDA